eukprot:gnl/MRDRNA2_/MRDRNA2_71462_c0_seq1.p1 gnl/MRDRNA2_/MRDRNA2_71462_c0~~gnl/MRDRNA2_/MRDRNA2_71462_c0_seq1.p1  ORF type:complete len:715 (-),score=158.26 gnl/MRDRNA2_/MRDRNA2_71462_c0_seq1:51-2048(-)
MAQNSAAENQIHAKNLLDEYLCKLPREVHEERPVMQFQKDGIRFGIAREGRCLIGDDMGLGKTMQALAIIAQYMDEWPALVVAPSAVRLVWREQAQFWLSHVLDADDVQVLCRGQDAIKQSTKLVIISYDLLARNEKFQRRADGQFFQVVCVDESHFIKDFKSQRTKAVLKICKSARRCVLLSGTPAVNKAAELYTQLQAVLPSKSMPSLKAYRDRYCQTDVQHFGGRTIIKYVGAKNKSELNAFLVGTVMIRRLKSDVLKQLPPKSRQRIVLDPTKIDKGKMARLKDLIQEGKYLDDSGSALAGLPNVFRVTAEAKLEAVKDYIEYLLNVSDDLKFLVFAHHQVMLDALQGKMEETHTKFIRIDGQTQLNKRAACVDQFQKDASTRVALLSITACGQGLTLTAAQTVVFAELYWVPGQMIQAEDRAHRIGQDHTVDVHYCIAEQTLDAKIFHMLNKKSMDTTGILDGSEQTMLPYSKIKALKGDTLSKVSDAATASASSIDINKRMGIQNTESGITSIQQGFQNTREGECLTLSKEKGAKSNGRLETETVPCKTIPSSLTSDLVQAVVKAKEVLEQEKSVPEVDVLSALDALEALGELSTDVLRSTMIGKTVNGLTKAAVAPVIRERAQTLTDNWRHAFRKRKETSGEELSDSSPQKRQCISAS